jgi:hypothetical protein
MGSPSLLVTRLVLPTTQGDSIFQFALLKYQSKRFERPGRTEFPGSIPPLSEPAQAALLSTLLMELSSKYKLNLDTEPILSRQLVLSPALPKGTGDTPALFIGGSNADRLANAAANVGIIPDTVTEGGWILNTSSVSTVLPQIEAYCLTLPPEAPVIILLPGQFFLQPG